MLNSFYDTFCSPNICFDLLHFYSSNIIVIQGTCRTLTCLFCKVKYWFICRKQSHREVDERAGEKGELDFNKSVVTDIKAFKVKNNSLCVWVCVSEAAWVSVCQWVWVCVCVCVCVLVCVCTRLFVSVCVWQESHSSVYHCQGQGEPSEKLRVCVCVYVCVLPGETPARSSRV